MERSALSSAAVATLLILTSPGVASLQQAPTLRSTTHAVPIWVAVLTPAGEPILDLVAEDFEVFDNGQRAELVAFGPRAKPLTMTILAGNPPSMRRHASDVRDAVRGLIEGMVPGEYAAVSGLTNSAGFVRPSYARREPGQPAWPTGQMPAVRAVIVMSPGMDFQTWCPTRRRSSQPRPAASWRTSEAAISWGSNPTFDGQDHSISVKVRRLGAIVRARTVYLAPWPQG